MITGRFATGRIQRFLFIRLQPMHHRLDDFNYSGVHMILF